MFSSYLYHILITHTFQTKKLKTHQTRRGFSNLLLSNFDESVQTAASFLYVSDSIDTESSAAVALQGVACVCAAHNCSFRTLVEHQLETQLPHS